MDTENHDPETGFPAMKLKNPAKAVATSKDRLLMKRAFDAYNANPAASSLPIDHPAWIHGDPRGPWELGWPVLCKRRFGCGAVGQARCHGPRELKRFRRWRDWRKYGAFWDRYLIEEWRPAPREYRVHLVNSTKIIGVDWKQPRDPDEEATDDGPKTSATHRFVSLNVKSLLTDQIRRQARRAMKAVGLEMGAVDIGVDPPTGRCWVFETNARPGVDRQDLLDAYVKAGAPRPAEIPEGMRDGEPVEVTNPISGVPFATDWAAASLVPPVVELEDDVCCAGCDRYCHPEDLEDGYCDRCNEEESEEDAQEF